MRNKEEIEKKLNELLKVRGELEIFPHFGIKNLDEFNMAIKVLKWVLEEDGKAKE